MNFKLDIVPCWLSNELFGKASQNSNMVGVWFGLVKVVSLLAFARQVMWYRVELLNASNSLESFLWPLHFIVCSKHETSLWLPSNNRRLHKKVAPNLLLRLAVVFPNKVKLYKKWKLWQYKILSAHHWCVSEIFPKCITGTCLVTLQGIFVLRRASRK